MHLETLRIKNYKSFKEDQTVAFGRCNMIIGKNGSGKSNLLNAIESAFCLGDSKPPQYNGNEQESLVEITLSNPRRLHKLPIKFTLTYRHREHPEYLVDAKPVSPSFVSSLAEAIGLNPASVVRQGMVALVSEMSPADRYNFFLRVTGISQYDERRAEALALLDSQNEEEINELLEKIEHKVVELDMQKERLVELEKLRKKRAEAEYSLMKWELHALNEEIAKVEPHVQFQEPKNTALLEFELKECRERLHDYLQAQSALERQIASYGSISEEKAALSKRRLELIESLSTLERQQMELRTEQAALKYFHTTRSKQERLDVLEKRLSSLESADGKAWNGRHSAIEERKRLWIGERQAKEELGSLQRKAKNLYDKLFCLGQEDVLAYEAIKEEPGVLGPLHSLISVPEELSNAFEAVAASKLFWIVVENEDIATHLVEANNATFIAMNRIGTVPKEVVEDSRMLKLSKAIKPDANVTKQIRPVIEYVCKDFYVCADLKLAVELSEKYNANVVTTDGDIVSRNGVITGGYGQPVTAVRELRECRAAINQKEAHLKEITEELKEIAMRLNEHTKESTIPSDSTSMMDEGRITHNAIVMALRWKIQLLKIKKIKIREEKFVKEECARIELRIARIKGEIQAFERRIPAEECVRMELLCKLLEERDALNEKIEALKKEESRRVDAVFGCDESDEIDQKSIQKKHILMDRRAHLLHKMGIADQAQTDTPDENREELVERIRGLNIEMRQFAGCSQAVHLAKEGRALKSQVEELQDAKARVRAFLESTDRRREEVFDTSVIAVFQAYKEYFRRISNSSSELALDGDRLVVTGMGIDPESLSGGQKAALALSFIFALQDWNASPFYLFDEVDANLDPSARRAFYELVRASDAQYFITTFKEDALFSADSFIGVVNVEKASMAGPIDAELAIETVRTVAL